MNNLRLPNRLRAITSCLLLSGIVFCAGCGSTPADTTGEFGLPASGPPAGQAAPAFAEDSQGQLIAREIEEADVVKVVGNHVFVLNRFKGLIIIDATNPDAPKIAGEYELRGRGVEMYVVGQRVFAILSADFYIYYHEMPGFPAGTGAADVSIAPVPRPGEPPVPEFLGSQLAIINVSNAASPTLDSKINLAGYAAQSRRVGDVIYVIGANIIPYSDHTVQNSPGAVQSFQDAFVASINVADPANPLPVDRKSFTTAQSVMHVSDTTIFATGARYDSDSGEISTLVQTIDISDPAGAISVRGSFSVPGTIRNRFFMDDYQGVFRVATESWGFGFRQVRLFTYDLADLNNVLPLGQTRIIENESLEAVRFDGPRGYAVTFLRVDPLFVIDLSDPANPSVTGELEVPGFSTHIEPRGDRLIAVGIDDTNGQRPAVAYYDVSNPAQPIQLGRVILGPPGSYTESQATYDEKAFKIIDQLNLIAIPFRHVQYPSDPFPIPVVVQDSGGSTPPGGSSGAVVSSSVQMPDCTNAVQLVDYSDTALTQRGFFEHRGRVERVGMVANRVFALSQVSFQTVDISDRDKPASSGRADFFTERDMPYYADDCGYGYFGEIPVDLVEGEDAGIGWIFRLMSQNCGAAGVVPLLGTFVGLAGLRTRRGRRRSR